MELVGQRIGNYAIISWLGDGAHVHAYLARDEAQARDVVIKVIKSDFVRTDEYVERFRQEAQRALALNHPHMVTIHAYDQQDDILYLVEEFLPGGSLLDIFSRYHGPLPTEAVLRTLDQIASVLDFAHAHGIVHGDLKPENVLYDMDGNAYLSDLGITKDLNKQVARSRAGLEFGNPNYMAPEEWQGSAANPRTDVYALGVLLFEMLTGQLPFSAPASRGFAFVHLMHLMSTPVSLTALRPDLPPETEQVVRKAIDKRPSRRFASAGELARAFHEALEGRYAPSEPEPEPDEETSPADAPAVPVSPLARLADRLGLPLAAEEGTAEAVPKRAPKAMPALKATLEPVPARAQIGIVLMLIVIAGLIGFFLGRWFDSIERMAQASDQERAGR